MNKILVIVGEQNSETFEFIKQMSEKYNNIYIVKKYLVKGVQQYEEAKDIVEFIDIEEIVNFEYVYTINNGGDVLAYSKSEIDRALQNDKLPVVIIEEENMLLKLNNDYRDIICPIYVERDIDESDLIKELEKNNKTTEEISDRLTQRRRIKEIWARKKEFFGNNFIMIDEELLERKKLFACFEVILKENDIDIKAPNVEEEELVQGFRKIWKNRLLFEDKFREYEKLIKQTELTIIFTKEGNVVFPIDENGRYTVIPKLFIGVREGFSKSVDRKQEECFWQQEDLSREKEYKKIIKLELDRRKEDLSYYWENENFFKKDTRNVIDLGNLSYEMYEYQIREMKNFSKRNKLCYIRDGRNMFYLKTKDRVEFYEDVGYRYVLLEDNFDIKNYRNCIVMPYGKFQELVYSEPDNCTFKLRLAVRQLKNDNIYRFGKELSRIQNKAEIVNKNNVSR